MKRNAERANLRAEKSDTLLKEKECERQKAVKANSGAQSEAFFAKQSEEQTKEHFIVLFIGQIVLSVVIVTMWLVERGTMLKECGLWFVNRFTQLLALIEWWVNVFKSYITDETHLALIIIAVMFYLAVLIGVTIGLFWIGAKLRDIFECISGSYGKNAFFKLVITVDLALGSFIVCLTLAEYIKAAIPLNVFSIWLIVAVVLCGLWNLSEIIEGVRRWRIGAE